MTDRTRLTVLQAAVVFAFCAFVFYFGLGAFGLVGADEPRYAQIAREMLTRHDWILPTLNGSPWLEKPVLLYWKIINSYVILGIHDWAARVPSAVHATALVMVVFFFMRRFRPGSELDAALITASMAGVIGFARGASTDMPLSASLSIALLSWWAWHETGRKLWLAGFYVLLAVGALTKGPVAPALAVLIVAAYSAARRDSKIFFRSLWAPGFTLFFVITAPWYVAIEMKAPQFFRVFLLEHNLERFGTNLYQHAQPFWYYIPVFLLGTLPWTVFTVPALVDAGGAFWRELRSSRAESALTAPTPTGPEASAVPGDLTVFLFLWIVIPIVFFSISRSKLPGYILPAIPPAAVLTADYLHRRRVVRRLQLALHSLLCGAIMAGALLAPWIMLHAAVPGKTRAIVAVFSGLIAILVLVVVRRGGLPTLHFATLVPLLLGLVFLLRFAAIPENDAYPIHGLILDITQSARPVDLELRRLGVKEDTPLAVFNVKRDVAYGLNFYRNQPITYYESERPRDLPSGIPAREHVVIAKRGSQDAVKAVVAPRQVTPLGDFPPQHLEFFLVSNPK
ncbi:MAG TPA: glycosyltransferase family 39 protein [Candidatus Angelobacter sp.]